MDEQARWIYCTVLGKTPAPCEFEFALQTVALLRQVFRQEFGGRPGVSAARRILRQPGLAPQHRSAKRNRGHVQEWKGREQRSSCRTS